MVGVDPGTNEIKGANIEEKIKVARKTQQGKQLYHTMAHWLINCSECRFYGTNRRKKNKMIKLIGLKKRKENCICSSI